MSREDYLAQVIRNLESDKNQLISILVEHHWCPKNCEAEGFHNVCKEPHTQRSNDYCGEAPEDCWTELVENKRPPETYCTGS